MPHRLGWRVGAALTRTGVLHGEQGPGRALVEGQPDGAGGDTRGGGRGLAKVAMDVELVVARVEHWQHGPAQDNTLLLAA